LIGTIENITDDTMMTHIFTTLCKPYATTIQNIEELIRAPTALQCMDAITKYAKRTTLIREIVEINRVRIEILN